jgi:hypothetical protein
MDALLAAEMLADAIAISSEAGQVVIINGTTYQCMVSDAQLSETLEQGGIMQKITTLVKVPATAGALSAQADMQIGKKLTYNSRIMRINQISIKPYSAWIQLDVIDADTR